MFLAKVLLVQSDNLSKTMAKFKAHTARTLINNPINLEIF